MRAIVLLFFSGAAALVYQTLWVKQLALVVGVDVYAVTTAVAAFFTGLALGAALLGRRADRATRPFALYAVLELGIAALGAVNNIRQRGTYRRHVHSPDKILLSCLKIFFDRMTG